MTAVCARFSALVVLLLAFACGETRSKPTVVAPEDAAVPDGRAADAPQPPPVVLPFVVVPSEEQALAAVGALPVWRLVIRRAEFLARRGDEGIAVGRVRVLDGGLWLADETEGGGALATRLGLPDRMELGEGARVVAWGAWQSEAGVWVWRAKRVDALPPATSELPEPPGLVVRRVKAGDLRPLSEVLAVPPKDPVRFAFYVRSSPKKPGDPWVISDSSKGASLAELYLPGADAPYGAQDYRAPDEHWRLSRRILYWLEAKRVRAPTREGQLPSIRASSPPRLVN